MLQLMQEGGVLMWPILIAGVLTIVAAVRKATARAEGLVDPSRMAGAILAVSVAWSLLGLRMVCRAELADLTNAPPVYLLGVSEAVTPAILGLVIVAVVGAIGALSRSNAASLNAPGPA
jgi:hypothetical protein